MASYQDNRQLDLFLDSALSHRPPKKQRPPISEETRQKMRNNRLGRKWSDEAKRKMSESAKRRPPISEETRLKLKARRPKEQNNFWKGGDVAVTCNNSLCSTIFYVRPYRAKSAKYCSRRCRKEDPSEYMASERLSPRRERRGILDSN